MAEENTLNVEQHIDNLIETSLQKLNITGTKNENNEEKQTPADVDGFIKTIFQEGFNIKKYGLLGKTLNEGEKDLKTGGIEEKRVEIEVIREIRVEVPVEVIKEVEKIVTKIEYISDKNGETELGGKIAELEEEISTKTAEIGTIRKEFSTKTTEMENNFQNEMSKKDKELDELRHSLDELRQTSDEKNNDNKMKLLQETLQKLR